MIPPELRTYLSAPRFAGVALVDAQGRPHLTRAGGWRLLPPGSDADLALVLRPDMCPCMPGENGASTRVAVVFSEPERFVAYQVKGRARMREALPEEVADAERTLGLLGETVQRLMGIKASLYQNISMHGARAMELTVEEAFQQSPGPGAGNRIEVSP